jgi:molybdopterin synthase catalytic subunit
MWVERSRPPRRLGGAASGPVSYNDPVLEPPTDARDWVAITDAPLTADTAVAWATTAGAGAVVTFLGVVRDHAEGRPGVKGMTYEAYEEPAKSAMREIVAEARRRWPDIERVALLHRVGELALSETSVAVVASAPHRSAAFEAARFCIDTLKESVPIWKQEHWSGGSDWAVEQHALRPVPATTAASVRES